MHIMIFRLLAVVTLAAITGTSALAAQTPAEIKHEVEQTLRDDRALRRLDVSIAGNEITLSGEVESFWKKSEALRRTFDVTGVGTVVSEIDVPVEEDQQRLIEDIAEAIQRYDYYRIWDYLDARLNNGVVTLSGKVTPERDKAKELFERIAKVRGVQDVVINVEVLPSNSGDPRLRDAIARRVFSNDNFEQFAGMTNPPFHIIVQNSVVTLVGYVQSNIERIEMQRIVAQTQGVMRVDNQLESLR